MASSRNKPSIDLDAFCQQVLERVQQHLSPSAGAPSVCVGYSGGLDSSVLLESLSRAISRNSGCSIRLSAIHVHHGLSPNANHWAAHCEEVCSSLRIPLQLARVTVAANSGEGLEAAARRARYQAFADVDADLLLLGQHEDDQAETLLLNLIRGTSVLGASAMPERIGRFVRPLLNVPRCAIRAYAHELGLRWIEDESNESVAFSRNYLRKEILPRLSERFPAAAKNLAQAAASFAEAQALLDDLAVLDGADQVPLPLSVLENKANARAMNALAFHLHQAGIRVASRAWLANLLKQLLTAAPDRQVCVPADGKLIHRYQGALVIESSHTEALESVAWQANAGQISWGSSSIRATLGRGQGIAKARLAGMLEFRTREGSDVLEIRPGLRRSLKDLMREARIPPWKRHRLPVLVSSGELVWVPFVGIAEKYRCGAEEDGISLEFDEASW